MDVTVVTQQFSCLYGFTEKVADLYEDDIPGAMAEQIGERVTLVNELNVFGTLKACTNQYYGGTGTSRSSVNGAITVPMLRKMAKSLMANSATMVTKVLSASNRFGTDAVAGGYLVYCHTDLEPDIRDLQGFIPAEKYASGTPMPNELGKCERFRFITSPLFVSILDGGAAVGATGLQSNGGTSIDVYQFIVTAEDAWSQVAVRGASALDPTFIPAGQKSKSDPHGQRGYAGTIWRKAVMVENNGWMAVGNVGVKAL
jgi:N4-gp56 family major capsid protein